MSLANPRWGAPRIHGEPLKLEIQLSQATVAKYIARHRKPPSQTWRTSLKNHIKGLVSADFFVVPTVTFRVLFVLVILAHDRRRPVHFGVTANPSAEWTARQLLEAFPWDSAPRYLLRDRDGSYGEKFHEAAGWLGIREVLTAPQSPWQNAYVERLIGSIRRECLDHVIVVNASGLQRVLRSYFEYYDHTRTHLALEKDAPVPRRVQLPEMGRVVELPQVGGLHHRYERRGLICIDSHISNHQTNRGSASARRSQPQRPVRVQARRQSTGSIPPTLFSLLAVPISTKTELLAVTGVDRLQNRPQ